MHTGRAFAAAVAVHVGGLALLARAFDRSATPPLASAATSAAAIAPARPPAPKRSEPIDVVFLDEPGNPPQDPSASQRGAARDGDRMRAAAAAHGGDALTARAHGDAPIATGPPGDGAGSSPLMKMRGPELRLDGFASALEAIAGRAELAPPVPITGRLQNRPGGGGSIDDSVASIDVDPDGTAHMTRKPDFSIHVPFPHVRKMLHSMKESIADWYADPYASTRYTGGADTPTMSQGMPACDTWGDICNNMYTAVAPHPAHRERPGDDSDDNSDDDGGGGGGGGIPILSGRLDITSYLERKLAHADVYSARKLALLDSTRPEREQRGAVFRTEQLDRSAILMRDNLARLGDVHDPAELHRVLFELWDECAEGTGAEGDAGARARGQVIGWIRAHLPAGGANAFTPAEIAALDAHRTSVQHFSPY